MSDTNLESDLKELGLLPESKKTLLLLPLIAVAWADGSIQAGEKAHILEFVDGLGGLDLDGSYLLEDWLRYPPTSGYIERGIDLICRYFRQRDADIDPTVLDRVLDEAEAVAAASGSGLLGFVQKVSREEVDALSWLRGVFGDALGIDIADAPPSARKARRGVATQIAGLMDAPPQQEEVAVLVQENFRRPKFLVSHHGMVVGADPSVDVSIPGLAPRHFGIVVDGSRFSIEALDDKVPVSVNGERIGKRRIFGGARIVAGSTIFSFKMAAQDEDLD